MQAIELQTQLIEEIKQIPNDKIAEIYDVIHYFLIGLNHENQAKKISSTTQIEHDETSYLLSSPANKARLLAAIAQVENNHLIDVDLESL